MTQTGSVSWSVDEISDASRFFESLPEVLPEATHLEVEGAAIVPEALALYREHVDGSAVLSPRQTLFAFGANRRLRCRLTPEFVAELRALLERHATPELVDHLHLYDEDRLLLSWHDAFTNALELTDWVPEERVRALAHRFEVAYERR